MSLSLKTLEGADCRSVILPGLRGKIPLLQKPASKLFGVSASVVASQQYQLL